MLFNPLIYIFVLLLAIAAVIYFFLLKFLIKKNASTTVRGILLVASSVVLSPGLVIGHGVMPFPAGLILILSITNGTLDRLNFVLWGITIALFSSINLYNRSAIEKQSKRMIIMLVAFSGMSFFAGTLVTLPVVPVRNVENHNGVIAGYQWDLTMYSQLLKHLKNNNPIGCIKKDLLFALDAKLSNQEYYLELAKKDVTAAAQINGSIKQARQIMAIPDNIALPENSECPL